MATPEDTKTTSVLRAVAERVNELDLRDLQQEIQALQLENQEVSRQLQERNFLQQLRQLEAQRRAERASEMIGRAKSRPDREIQRAVDELHHVVGGLDDGAIQSEMVRLQTELQDLNRQMQERQHLMALKQMISQPVQGQINFQVNMPMLTQGIGMQFGGPAHPAQSNAADGAPHVTAASKRQAILDVMREQRNRRWTPTQIKQVLTERGMQHADKGTPIRSLLWKMHKDGMVDRPSEGVYAMLGAVAVTEPAASSDAARAGTDGISEADSVSNP